MYMKILSITCPGNIFPGNVLSGKRLSGKVIVRETSVKPSMQRRRRSRIRNVRKTPLTECYTRLVGVFPSWVVIERHATNYLEDVA